MIRPLPFGRATRHEFEDAVIRFLTGFGYVFFTAIVAIPFYVMVMTSLKNQAELLQNPLDFTIDLSKGWGLFRSYEELFTDFNFRPLHVDVVLCLGHHGGFLTLLFSVPGAYAVARLRFKGRGGLLALDPVDLHGADDRAGAADLYRLLDDGAAQHHHRARPDLPRHHHPGRALHAARLLPRPPGGGRGSRADGRAEPAAGDLEDHPAAGASGAGQRQLYVFMIAWNEFLLAFMLLDDPSIFTLTRGIASLDSSKSRASTSWPAR